MSTIYLTLAAMAVLGLGGIALYLARRPRGAHLEPLPLAPLQKRAWLGLALGLFVTLAILVLVVYYGLEAWMEEAGLRYTFYLLLAVSVAGHGLVVRRRWRDGGTVQLDERDREILDRAPAVQSVALLLTVAVWAVVLTEVYRDRGEVPIAFPLLIFWSCFVVNSLALSVGVLLGYRAAGKHAEG